LGDVLTKDGGKMAAKALRGEVRDDGHSCDAAKRLTKTQGIEAKRLRMGGTWL
jgi:putative DNA primase/helicase